MGTLHAQSAGREEVFSFEYAPEWLRNEAAFAFDPDLQLLEGAQYPAQSRSNFGIFLDSSPDRWGRLLMQRRENLRARQEERKPRRLTDWDYLLGVHDETRLGALRLRSSSGGEFLDSDRRLAAPPITSVRELQTASDGLERHIDEEDNPEYARWLNQLWAPGSSLGRRSPESLGARRSGNIFVLRNFPAARICGIWPRGKCWRTGSPRNAASSCQRRDCWKVVGETNRPSWSNDSIERQAEADWLLYRR